MTQVETQPGSPLFDGADAFEAYQSAQSRAPEANIEAFSEAMQEALAELDSTERFKKTKREFLDGIWSDMEYTVIDKMGEQVEWFVRDMAESAIKEILEGREGQMRRYLGCNGYTGRDRQHSVIHGKFFETGAIALRKKIAQAHADLIQNERILDLEDQVKSLVDQVNEKDRIIESQRDRLSEARF